MLHAICLLFVAHPAQTPRYERTIQTRLEELRKEAPFPAVAVGYAMEGNAGYVVLGEADVEKKIPLTQDHRMLAGSIGKTYFAAVMLQYADENKVSLEEKISKWLGNEPWFKRLPNAESITLRMLMNHTSGVPEHVQSPEMTKALATDPGKVWKPEELVAFILDKPAIAPAGEKFSYADTNYILMGMYFEKMSGKNFYSEVERRILKPLHLEDTIPAVSREVPKLANGYSRAGSPFPWEGPMIRDGKFVFNTQMEWTGGGFATNALDLAWWAFKLHRGDVLKPELLAMMHQGVPANTGRDHKYGLGVQIRPSADYGTGYGHSGWFPGYLSDMEYFPDKKIAVAVQFNTDDISKLKRPPRAYILEVMKILTK